REVHEQRAFRLEGDRPSDFDAQRVSAVFTAVVLFAYAGFAFAYRPFDGTDADVAKAGELEIELGPLQWLRETGKRFLQAPALVANFGLSHEHELVIEGRHEIALDREAGEPRSALVDNGAF